MHWRIRDPLLKPLMGSGLIEVESIRLEEAVELLRMEDQIVIQAFSPHASQKAFTNGIRLRGPIRGLKHFDATDCRHSCKIRPEFPVIIPNQIFGGLSIRSRFPELLRNPKIGRSSCHIHMDPPSATATR